MTNTPIPLSPLEATQPVASELRSRTALVTADVKVTSPTYYNDGTTNDESRAYEVTFVTSVREDVGFALLDSLTVRIAVPAYLTDGEPLMDAARRLTGIASVYVDIETKERARLTTQAFVGEETLPTEIVSIADYNGADDEGLSASDAAATIRAYLSRFEQVVLLIEDVRLSTATLERMGIVLEAIPVVYARIHEVYTLVTTMLLMQQTIDLGALAATPGIADITPGLGTGTRERAVAIAELMQSISGVVEIDGAVNVIVEHGRVALENPTTETAHGVYTIVFEGETIYQNEPVVILPGRIVEVDVASYYRSTTPEGYFPTVTYSEVGPEPEPEPEEEEETE